MRQRHDRRVGCVAGDEGGREAGLQRRVLVLEEVRVEVGRDRDGAVSHPPADAVQVLALVRHGGRVGCRRSWKRTWPSRSFLARGRPALKTGRVQRSGLASGSEPTDGTTVLLVASYGVGPFEGGPPTGPAAVARQGDARTRLGGKEGTRRTAAFHLFRPAGIAQ